MTLSLFSPEPVRDPANFVGREREVVQLSELLAAGRSCAVVGPPGSGKTSLLLHIGQAAAMVLDIPPLVVYLDLAGVRTTADFYAPILRALSQPGDDELALGQAFAGETPPILLQLDNLDRAGAGWSGLVRSAVRGWVRDGKLLILAASGEPLDRAAPDLQTTLLQLSLPPLPEREARSLVADLARRAGLEVAEPAVARILHVAGGYPNRIQRALELWAQSGDGSAFDWQRTFREQFPAPSGLDDSLRGYAPAVEAHSDQPAAAVAELPPRAPEPAPASPAPGPRSYTADDPSAFLWMLILLSLAIGVWWAIGSWWGALGFAATLLGWVAAAGLLVRADERWRASLFVAATRLLPLVGRLAPR
jgi:hypothetical protein